MVLILDGNSEIDAHVRSNLCYVISSGHSNRYRSVTNLMFYPKRPVFFHACATCSEIPSNISAMLMTVIID